MEPPENIEPNKTARSRLVAAVCLLVVGVALVLIGLFVSAHFSSKASAEWLDESARSKAAYADTLAAVMRRTGKAQGQLSPAELAGVIKVSRDKTWSAPYDPAAAVSDQHAANAAGLVGVAGFLLLVAGVVVARYAFSGGRRQPAESP